MNLQTFTQLPPVIYKKGTYNTFITPFGTIYPIFQGEVLIGLSFSKPHLKKASIPPDIKNQLSEYFHSQRTSFEIKTSFENATHFEIMVWNVLKEIPYGETRTYKWLAQKIGNPRATRAVGQALKRNPIPIIFPCHRIIESKGSIGGYSAGVNIKRSLLDLEYYSLLKSNNRVQSI